MQNKMTTIEFHWKQTCLKSKSTGIIIVQYVLAGLAGSSSIRRNAIYVHIKCRITQGFRKEKLSYVPIGKVTTVYKEQMRPVIVFPASFLQAHKRAGACLNLDDPPLSEITDAHPALLSSYNGEQGMITFLRRQWNNSHCVMSIMGLS